MITRAIEASCTIRIRPSTAETAATAARHSDGFTRVELAVIVSTVLLLAALALPALGHGEHKTKALDCQDNLRRLSLAWVLFANDHDGTLAGNLHGSSAMNPLPGQAGWASGWLDWTTSPANTNRSYLVDPRYAQLADYVQRDARVYKCPADTYLSPAQRARGWVERARSYSANIGVGPGNAEEGPWDATWVHVKRMSDFTNPGPLDSYVFLEEHPDSINDPAFFAPYVNQWVDVPASFHSRAANVSFADGHVEPRLWQSAATVIPVRYDFPSPVPSANDPDIAWFRSHTPRR